MKIKSYYFLLSLFLLLSMIGCKQKDYRMNGTYMPYVYKNQTYTNPPEGYEPFYINYIGRHGSRYPVSNADIQFLLTKLKDAEKKSSLSNNGKELILQLERIEKECEGKWGNLSTVGEKQIQGIAQRMLTNFPDLFKAHIYVQSDMAERCVKSMEAFMNEFYKQLPKGQISVELLPEQNAILNFFDINLAYLEYKKNGKWRQLYHNFADSVLLNSRPVRNLFTGQYADTMTNKVHFMHALYSTYAILPDTDLPVSLENFFTGEELFSLWNVENVRQYLEKGPSPESKGLAVNMCFPLLEDFLVTTYNAITEGDVSADFRFGHAETIIPFAALLGIPIASQKESNLNLISTKWLDFQISPMAANIQWILYSNDTGNYLIKMLLNEKEVLFPIKSDTAPYYDWEDVRTYYQTILDSLPIIPSFSTERQVKYYKEP